MRVGVGGEGVRCVDETIGFGLYQSGENRESVGHVPVFGLQLWWVV